MALALFGYAHISATYVVSNEGHPFDREARKITRQMPGDFLFSEPLCRDTLKTCATPIFVEFFFDCVVDVCGVDCGVVCVDFLGALSARSVYSSP